VDRLLLGLMGVVLTASLMGLMGHWRWLVSVTEIGAMVGAVTALSGAVVGLRHGYRPAGLYILGLVLLFGAAFLLVLSNWGVLGWTAMHLNVLQLGVAAELLVFSVALGARIRVMRRAQELHARAEHLAVVAETDTLTGVANRAGLAQVAQRRLQPGQRHALLLLDLDDFKPVNDRHGHRGRRRGAQAGGAAPAGSCARPMWWRGSAATSSWCC
jgi:predicted signal transduction protein with EAL and GGDEF domain